MDFSKMNIQDILKSGMKNKFQDFPPFDFEDFIGQLFKDNGYEVMKTPRTGDYGADLILTKSGEKIAVQIKRYLPENKVGVQEINQIIGAKDFYKCNKAMIITTSSFSKSGATLATKTSTELWDWDKLQKRICDTYLDGKDYYSYFGDSSKRDEAKISFEFKFTKAQFGQIMQKVGSCTLIYAYITNATDRNIYVQLGYPTFISADNRQTDACGHYTGYFNQGVVYAGASVEVAFIFRTEQVPFIRKGDRLIFKWFEDVPGANPERHTFDMVIPKSMGKSSCYVVTMCFGKSSQEYLDMVVFRERVLRTCIVGRGIIDLYYKLGGFLADRLRRNRTAKRISRFLLKSILIFVRWCNRHYDV